MAVIGGRVLIVDDEPGIRALCARVLSREGYQVMLASSGDEGLRRLEAEGADLAIIDVMMPGRSGIDVCEAIRHTDGISAVPVLFLTARDDIADKAAGFAVGGDDYLTKPFDVRELVMRVRALLRRQPAAPARCETVELSVSGLKLDPRRQVATTREGTARLTPMETSLLAHLMSEPGCVFSSEGLLRQVWGYPPGSGSKALVRAHVRNIRAKIEPDPANPRHLVSVGRSGYRVGS